MQFHPIIPKASCLWTRCIALVRCRNALPEQRHHTPRLAIHLRCKPCVHPHRRLDTGMFGLANMLLGPRLYPAYPNVPNIITHTPYKKKHPCHLLYTLKTTTFQLVFCPLVGKLLVFRWGCTKCIFYRRKEIQHMVALEFWGWQPDTYKLFFGTSHSLQLRKNEVTKVI